LDDFLEESSARLVSLIHSILDEFRNDIAQLVGNNEMQYFVLREKIDWVTEKREPIFREVNKMDLNNCRIGNDIKDKKFRDIIVEAQAKVHEAAGIISDRISLYSTYFFNNKQIREIIMQSSYAKFLNSITKDLVKIAREANLRFTDQNIIILYHLIEKETIGKKSKDLIKQCFEPFSNKVTQERKNLIDLLYLNRLNSSVFCCCFSSKKDSASNAKKNKSMRFSEAANSEFLAFAGINIAAKQIDSLDKTGEKVVRSIKNDPLAPEINSLSEDYFDQIMKNVPSAVLSNECIRLINDMFIQTMNTHSMFGFLT